MLDGVITLGLTVPVAGIGLWKHRRDYRKHKRLTRLGLLAVAAIFVTGVKTVRIASGRTTEVVLEARGSARILTRLPRTAE